MNKASTLLLENCVDKMMRVNKAEHALGFLVQNEHKLGEVIKESEVALSVPDLLASKIKVFNKHVKTLFCKDVCQKKELFIDQLNMPTYLSSEQSKYIHNIRYLPIVENDTLYAIIILINIKMSPVTKSLVDVTSFVSAAIGMLRVNQLRLQSNGEQKDKIDHLLIEKILANTFHPTLLFDDELKVVKANSAAQNLFNANTVRGWLPVDKLLGNTLPNNALEIFSTINKFCFLGHLDCDTWSDVEFVLSPYQKLTVDIHLFEYKRCGVQNFGLMLNDKNQRTEDNNSHEHLASIQRFKALTNVVPTAIMQVDKHWQCSYVNDTWTRYTGLDLPQSKGAEWLSCISDQDKSDLLPQIIKSAAQQRQFKTELVLHLGASRKLWVELHAAGLFNERYELTGLILTLQDITSSKKQAEKLVKLANYDHLTGLTNRAFFNDRLAVAISRVERHGLMALVFLDLDRFKYINDTFGHPVGDKVIQEVGNRLRKTIRDEDSIARLGGDEFAIILTDVTSHKFIAPIIEKILASMRMPLDINGNQLNISCSIGVVTSDDGTCSTTDMLRKVDLALYKAKEMGRDQYCFYSDKLENDSATLVNLRDSLCSPESHHFSLAFQPQINAKTGELLGVESLARWSHPKSPEMGPSAFIGLIENNGLMSQFSDWLFEENIRVALIWHQEGLLNSTQKIAINLSANQLHLPDLADNIIELFSESQAPAHWFTLEVTETAFIQDPITAGENLRGLKEAGFSIALDDFGTGYSSLSLLRQMPINTIKIDRSFVKDIIQDKDDASIVLAVIGLGTMLKMNIIAEGVEDEQTSQWLIEHDCVVHQGNYFCEPLNEHKVRRLLRSHTQLQESNVIPISK